VKACLNELYFNAARLDRSMALRTRDSVAVAKPRVERIAETRPPLPAPGA
jgi:Ala-tRNA(Pro) deacylase